ncbi:MAG: hypothetical protein HY902_03775, partial [Deltaproteobacteria bacterium]|nr:hypothetical protein [Deltaproteobacteria bacterium]
MMAAHARQKGQAWRWLLALAVWTTAGCDEDPALATGGPASSDTASDSAADAAGLAKDASAEPPDVPVALEVVADAAAETAPEDDAAADTAPDLPWGHPPGDRSVCDPCEKSGQCAEGSAACVALG